MKPAFRLCLIAVTCLLAVGAQAAVQKGAIVFHETKHDVSLPLRDMARMTAVNSQTRHEMDAPRRATLPRQVGGTDTAVQSNAPAVTLPVTILLNFDGQGADGVAPPDTNGSVGGTQYVQWVNLEYNVYDKTTGGLILGPVAGNAFWSGFGGSCQTKNSGDPIILYDKAAGRWLAVQNVFTSPYLVCLAVSDTDDATGTYHRYSFSISPTTDFPDYPKWGVWPDGYYMSYNAFKNGVTFNGFAACAVDRAAVLAGSAATMQCFKSGTAYSSALPSDQDGLTPPPAGAPNHFLALGTTTTSLNKWDFHVDFVTPANSTFTGPTTITTRSYTLICSSTRACIPQPTGGEKLDALGDRLIYRNAYRNFGTYESMTVAHTVKPGGTSTATAAVRWYEIRNPSSPTVFQQGTYQNASTSLWLPTTAQDKLGDFAIGFNASSTSLDPSVWFNGRVPTDAPGTLEAPRKPITGTGVQKSTSNRWGDYASISVDPTDDCTMWLTTEYIKTTGSFAWSTRITKFKYNSCN